MAAVLLIGAGTAYWFLYRPVPKTSGRVSAPVSKEVVAARDRHGIPHIIAESLEDALFAQGYVMAQDRLWQMDLLRRLATGTLAEVAGQQALESDLEARRLRIGQLSADFANRMPPADKAVVAAFARGVNHFIDTTRDRLPIEFRLMGYDPKPWSVADTIAICLQMYRTLTATWRTELLKASMIETGNAEMVEALFPVLEGSEFTPGSNAWAVSGRRTASGRPILANDPHLEFSLPSVWHLAHLKAPGLNVAGAALVGVPGILIGRNERIAWGLTNLGFDVQDLYKEKIDTRTGRVEFRGRLEMARGEREVVLVRDGRTVDAALWVTRHGPVFLQEGGAVYSLRWAAAEMEHFGFPILDLNRASNWEQFRAACARFPGPAQNFVYADRDGNIGYQVAGRLPVRRRHKGDVPADGASGEQEWDGWIPFEDLPSAYNPEPGLLITANQNPFPPRYKYPVGGNFAPRYRADQIGHLLAAKEKWRAEEMAAVQTDVYSEFGKFLAREIVGAYDRRGRGNVSLAPAADLLRNWDGQMARGRPEPFILTLAFQHLRKVVAERASPARGARYEAQMGPAAIERLVRQRPPSWFEDWDMTLLRAFADAVEEGKRMQGRDPKRWDYGAYNQLHLRHPVMGRIRWLGQYFNIGPYPMSGSSTTVKQTTRRLGPSMRFIADLGDDEGFYLQLVTGQSGHLLSGHYKDQWKDYYDGRPRRVSFREPESVSVLRFQPN